MMKRIAMSDAREQLLAEHLERITAISTDSLNGLRSLILGGSFSRNEGSMIPKEGGWAPLKDYDLYAVVEKQHARDAAEAVPSIRARIYQELHLPPYHESDPSPTGFQVSLEIIREDAIPYLPNDLSNLELKLAGRVLWGDDVLPLIPVRLDRVPLTSGLRHLLNKFIGALELWGRWITEEIGPDSETVLAVRYHRSKTILDFVSALLLLKGAWVPGYQARLDRLRLLEREGPLLSGLNLLSSTVERALAFKLNPYIPETREAIDDWYKAKDELLMFSELLCAATLGYRPGVPTNGFGRFISHARLAFLLPYAEQMLRIRRVPSIPGVAQLAVLGFSLRENLRIGEMHTVHPLLRSYAAAWAWVAEPSNHDARRFMTQLLGSWPRRARGDRASLRDRIISLFKRCATRKRLKRSL